MSTSYNAGEARLSIVPDATNFRRKLEAEIKKIEVDFPVDLSVDTKAATARMDAWRKEQSARDISIGVDVNTARADAKLSALSGSASAAHVSLKAVAAVAAAGLSPALALSVAEIAQGLQQVSQAGLALPGMIGGAVASFGTFAVGANGMVDALKAAGKASEGSAKDVEAYNKALEKMAPNAADVVRTIAGFKPAFQDLQKSVANDMFAGVGASIKQMVDADLPTLQKGMTAIARSWNTDIKALTGSLGDGQSRGLLDRLMGNTAESQKRFAAAIDPLVKGIGTLVASGSDALPRMADGIGAVASRFNAFIESADRDGRLSKWINDGITGVGKLGESVLNIGKAFTAITKASGGGFLEWLQRATSKLQEFLNSDAGQEKLKNLFETGREQLSRLADIAENLGPVLGQMFSAATDSVNVFLPVIQTVANVLGDCPGLVGAVTSAFLGWKSITAVSDMVLTLGKFSGLLTTLPTAASAAGTGASVGLAPLAATLGPIYATLTGIYGIYQAMQHMDLSSPEHRAELGRRGLGALAPDPSLSIPGFDQAPTVSGAERRGIPSRASGGPSPTSGMRGPTGGFITELHPDEWVLPKHARAAIGDSALWAITAGRSFAGGGFIDPNGNPVTPGIAPGLGAAAPAANPVQNWMGGLGQTVLSGLGGGMFGGFFDMLNAPAPDPSVQTVSQQLGLEAKTQFGTPQGNFMAAASTLPGIWGALAALNSPDPAGATMNWGTQTVSWLTNFASNTLQGFGSALLGGGLGILGLQSSILSPSNPWNQAGQSVANFAMGSSGPLGAFTGKGGRGGSSGGGSGAGGLTTNGISHLASDLDYGGAGGSGGGGQSRALNWQNLDAIAGQMGLTMISGYRSPNGPTIAGVPAAKSYHASGRAHDYGNGVRTAQELQFAMLMAQEYGPKLKELIYDDPRFPYTINNGRVVGPFGSFYTAAQSGDHSNHVHVAFDTGGWLKPGSTMAYNGTGKDELILTAPQQQKLADQGINPASLLHAGPPADTAVKAVGAISAPSLAPAPTSQDHNLKAVSKGIGSASSAIGNLVSTAAGAAGAMTGGGAGAAGGIASSAIQMGGQLLAGAINVGSSLLVGSVPGSYGGAQDRAYGRTVRAPQPAMAGGGNTWNFTGISDVNRIIQEVDLRDSQHRAGLAKWGG